LEKNLKAVHHIISASADFVRALNTGFNARNMNRPTGTRGSAGQLCLALHVQEGLLKLRQVCRASGACTVPLFGMT
jgi:hypothetical protein